MTRYLRHEKLIAYQLARDVARWVRYEARFPRRESSLKDQAKRAADSLVLNLAEGCYREGKDRAYHYRIAMGSAAECSAVFDLLNLDGVGERQAELRRVVAMIRGLS